MILIYRIKSKRKFWLLWRFSHCKNPNNFLFCGLTFAYIFHSHFTPVCILYGTLYSKHRLHSILHAVTSSGITKHLTDGKSGITRSYQLNLNWSTMTMQKRNINILEIWRFYSNTQIAQIYYMTCFSIYKKRSFYILRPRYIKLILQATLPLP